MRRMLYRSSTLPSASVAAEPRATTASRLSSEFLPVGEQYIERRDRGPRVLRWASLQLEHRPDGCAMLQLSRREGPLPEQQPLHVQRNGLRR